LQDLFADKVCFHVFKHTKRFLLRSRSFRRSYLCELPAYQRRRKIINW